METMNSPNREDGLVNWFLDSITYFRKSYENLSSAEKEFGKRVKNYLSPCQIEIIWLKYPEYQFVITSHFSDTEDLKVTVNGPYSSNEFIQKIEELLRQPKWKRPIKGHSTFGGKTYSEGLASALNMLIFSAKESLFSSNEGFLPRLEATIDGEVWVNLYSGDILITGYVPSVESAIEYIKKQYEASQKIPPTIEKLPKETQPSGFFTFFYPPIIIGEYPRPTIHDRLTGVRYELILRNNAFDMTFAGRDLIVSKSGQIFVSEQSKIESLRIFNIIMAIGTLRNFNFNAVRENELGNSTYNKETKTLGQSSWPLSTIRMMQGDIVSRSFLSGQEVKQSELQVVIREAEIAYENRTLVEELRMFIEAQTHILDSQYGQSFILSWTIIEKFLYQLWTEKVTNMGLDKDRKSKLLSPGQWSLDYVVEVLNVTCDITEQQYKEFMELKKERNGYVHEGRAISKENAEKSLNRARDIVLNKLGKLNQK